MGLLQGLFRLPNVEELKQNGDMGGLIKALKYRDVTTRWMAAAALGELAIQMEGVVHASRAVDALSEIAQNPEEPKVCRWNAARAMGQMGVFIKAPPLLTRTIGALSLVIKDKDRELRLAAAEALGVIDLQIKDPSFFRWAVEPLIQSLADTNGRVRDVVIHALADMDEMAQAALIDALWDKNWKIREGAVDVLGLMGWMPEKDRNGAAYWTIKGKWDQCVVIGEPAVEALIATLKLEHAPHRPAVVQTLARIGLPAVPMLVDVLHHPDKDVRKASADALEKIVWEIDSPEIEAFLWIARQQWNNLLELGDEAIAPMIAVITDRDVQVRANVARTLGKLAQKVADAPALETAVEPLCKALGDVEHHVRLAVADALGDVGASMSHARPKLCVIKALIGALSDEDSEIRRQVANALDRVDWQPSANETAARYWLAKQDWDHCAALGRTALKPLWAALLDWDKAVRLGAAATLDRLKYKPGRDEHAAAYWAVSGDWERCAAIGQNAVRPLCAALRFRGMARQPAVQTLGVVGAGVKKGKLRDEAVRALCAALEDEELSEAAARALGQMGDGSAVFSLIRCLEAKRPIADAAARALVQINEPSIKPLLHALTDAVMGRAAADVLALMGQPAVAALLRTLKDEDRNEMAANLLDRVGWKPSIDEESAQYWIVRRKWDQCAQLGAVAIPPLMTALAEGGETVRQAAAATLGDVGEKLTDEHQRQQVIAALTAAFRDWEYAVRRRAAGALDRLGWKPGNDETSVAYWITRREWKQVLALGETAVPLLIATLKDRSEEVRLAAIDTLGAIGDKRAVNPLVELLRDKGMRQNASRALRRIGATEE